MKIIPNILSVFRICLVPIFIITYLLDDNEVKYWALGIFIIANASDVLDGFIARRYNAQTKLGKLLDPLGDKLLVFSALICISVSRPVLIWAVCLYFVKEVLMGIGGLLIYKRAQTDLPQANWLGKTATVFFFLVCASLMLFGSSIISDNIAVILMSAAICLALAAFINYLHLYVKIFKNRKTGE